jgi:uncharacterized protein YjlB
VLAVYKGWVDALLGGDGGEIFRVSAGDVVILPAGTGHKNAGQGGGFSVVGSYPDGQFPDMNYCRPDELPQAVRNIASVPLPVSDPVLGTDGGLLDNWVL